MELKPTFTKKMMGYSPEEVDSYIMPLLAKQNALARENDDLKKQLLEALHTLQPAKDAAEKIRNAAAGAQAQAEQIISDAKAQAEALMQATRSACDSEMEQFQNAVAMEMEIFCELRRLVSSFQQTALQQCREQMAQIEHNANRLGTIHQPNEEEFKARVLKKMRADLVEQKQREHQVRRDGAHNAIRKEKQTASDAQTKSKNVVWTESGKQ